MTTPRDDIAGLSERLIAEIGQPVIYRNDATLREAATAIDALLKERDALQARVKELEDQLADFLDPTLKSFWLEDGQFNMLLAGDVVQRVALVLTTWFRESGAKNYVEIRINARDEPFESYVFNVQKIGDGGKTPHELRTEAESRATSLQQERDEAIKLIRPLTLLAEDTARVSSKHGSEFAPEMSSLAARARSFVRRLAGPEKIAAANDGEDSPRQEKI